MGVFFTSLGYELKPTIGAYVSGSAVAIVALSIVISALMANLATTLLIKIRFVRKYVFRNNWIEGFWYNIDHGTEGKKDVFSANAISEIRFKDPSTGYQTVSYRLSENREIFTISRNVILLGAENMYINYTSSSAKGPFKPLIAAGFFFASPGSKFINTYDGVVMEMDGASYFQQRAMRMSHKQVRSLRREYGNDWVRVILGAPADGSAKDGGRGATHPEEGTQLRKLSIVATEPPQEQGLGGEPAL